MRRESPASRLLPNSRLTVGRVLESLLFDFVGILPDDLAGPRIDQLEAVEDIVTGALRGPGRQAAQLAGEKIIGAFELNDVRIAGRGDLTRLLERPFAFQRLHPIAG